MSSVASWYSKILAGGEARFWNYGYWTPETQGPAEASVRLLEHLIGHFPRDPGRILDVAFGQGSSTKHLCALFGAANVTGINIARDQVDFARRSGILCDLQVMDAAQMEFDTASFKTMLCMEAAFHFESRRSFLANAWRILMRRGRLIMSDVLFRSGTGLDDEIFPPENRIETLGDYRELFLEAGFRSDMLRIEQTTSRQLIPHIAYMAERHGFLAPPDSERVRAQTRLERWYAWFMITRLLNVLDCVIVVADKC